MKSNAALKYLALAAMAESFAPPPYYDYEPKKRVSSNSTMSPSKIRAKKKRRKKNKEARKQRKKS